MFRSSVLHVLSKLSGEALEYNHWCFSKYKVSDSYLAHKFLEYGPFQVSVTRT